MANDDDDGDWLSELKRQFIEETIPGDVVRFPETSLDLRKDIRL